MDENLKRGVDLQNRMWESGISRRFRDTFKEGGPIDRLTFLGILVVFIVNLYVISAIFGKDLTPSYASSAFLQSIFNFLEGLNIVSKVRAFSLISLISLGFAPIGIYFFVRKVVRRSEFAAAIATLIFVVPNPISPNGMPLIYSLFNGDGAHMVAFSFIPFILLYFKAFLGKGIYVWGFMAVMATALIALISPFAFFNLLIFYLIVTVSEGFMAGFRITFVRFLMVLMFATSLCLFWYSPALIAKILVLESFSFAAGYFSKIFPLLIPIVPVVGVMSFLVFDRREKLQPVFISSFLFVIYLLLYTTSRSLNTQGLFTAERYLPEVIFAASFFAAIILRFVFDIFIQKARIYMNNKQKFTKFLVILFFVFSFAVFLLIVGIYQINVMRQEIYFAKVVKLYHGGVGSIFGKPFFASFTSVFSTLISIIILVVLIYFLRYNPFKMQIIAPGKKVANEDKK